MYERNIMYEWIYFHTCPENFFSLRDIYHPLWAIFEERWTFRRRLPARAPWLLSPWNGASRTWRFRRSSPAWSVRFLRNVLSLAQYRVQQVSRIHMRRLYPYLANRADCMSRKQMDSCCNLRRTPRPACSSAWWSWSPRGSRMVSRNRSPCCSGKRQGPGSTASSLSGRFPGPARSSCKSRRACWSRATTPRRPHLDLCRSNTCSPIRHRCVPKSLRDSRTVKHRCDHEMLSIRNFKRERRHSTSAAMYSRIPG